MFSIDETIAAIATASGGAARAIVRMSGPTAVDCLRRCFAPLNGWPGGKSPGARILTGELSSNPPQPCDAYIWPSTSSYTRQPMVELHVLGSPPLASAALRIVCATGARLATPGEFTLRAFLAGRMDLTQAEAVLGLIDATDRQTLDVAIAQLAGGLSGPLHGLRERLLDLLADLEAGLDFAEEHIEFVTVDEAISRLTAATAELDSLLNSLTARSLVTEWPHVVLVGCPNTGKSSLFNALVGSEPAIVSCVSGTTRDYLQAPLRLESLTCMLVDSAGVEANAPHDSISALAQEMTAIQSGQAVLRLLCVDATRELNDWERTQLRDCGKLVVLTKCDCPELISTSITGIKTSARFGRGLDELKARIAARLLSISGDAVPATAERCRASLVQTAIGLKNAIQLAQDRAGDELVASEIRFALEELGKVTGVTYTEDVLDRIFSRFCIGK